MCIEPQTRVFQGTGKSLIWYVDIGNRNIFEFRRFLWNFWLIDRSIDSHYGSALRRVLSLFILPLTTPLFAFPQRAERLARFQGCGKGSRRRKIRNRCLVPSPRSPHPCKHDTTPVGRFPVIKDPVATPFHLIPIAPPPSATCFPALWRRHFAGKSRLDLANSSPRIRTLIVNSVRFSALRGIANVGAETDGTLKLFVGLAGIFQAPILYRGYLRRLW